jgi:hypothetical protein
MCACMIFKKKKKTRQSDVAMTTLSNPMTIHHPTPPPRHATERNGTHLDALREGALGEREDHALDHGPDLLRQLLHRAHLCMCVHVEASIEQARSAGTHASLRTFIPCHETVSPSKPFSHSRTLKQPSHAFDR